MAVVLTKKLSAGACSICVLITVLYESGCRYLTVAIEDNLLIGTTSLDIRVLRWRVINNSVHNGSVRCAVRFSRDLNKKNNGQISHTRRNRCWNYHILHILQVIECHSVVNHHVPGYKRRLSYPCGIAMLLVRERFSKWKRNGSYGTNVGGEKNAHSHGRMSEM